MSAYTEEQKKTLEEYIKNNVEAGLELSWYFAPVGEAGCGGKEDVLMPAASLIKNCRHDRGVSSKERGNP